MTIEGILCSSPIVPVQIQIGGELDCRRELIRSGHPSHPHLAGDLRDKTGPAQPGPASIHAMKQLPSTRCGLQRRQTALEVGLGSWAGGTPRTMRPEPCGRKNRISKLLGLSHRLTVWSCVLTSLSERGTHYRNTGTPHTGIYGSPRRMHART